jgi:hypothetical protein
MTDLARSFPVIDPNVKHVGVSKLRELNATKLRDLDKTLVIQDDDTPLAVVLSYEQYLDMQEERENIIATLEALFEKDGKSSDLILSCADPHPARQKHRNPAPERCRLPALRLGLRLSSSFSSLSFSLIVETPP